MVSAERSAPRSPILAPPGLASFFRLSDAWELSDLQQCKLLHCPSVAVLVRYRAGQGPRLTAVQQKRIALLAGIHAALSNHRWIVLIIYYNGDHIFSAIDAYFADLNWREDVL